MPGISPRVTRGYPSRGWRPESGVKSDGRGSGLMVMLGGGTDILGAVVVPGGGDGARPQLAGWFEVRATQVLEQPEGVASHGQAAPGPVQDSPDRGLILVCAPI
jgi:hypothetical protein